MQDVVLISIAAALTVVAVVGALAWWWRERRHAPSKEQPIERYRSTRRGPTELQVR